MNRFIAIAATAAALAAGSAQAANVSWSVGINTPYVGSVITSAPAYYAPAPVVYAPAPAYYAPVPVYWRPRVAYVRPLPVVYPRFYPGWHAHGHPYPAVAYRGWR